MPPPSTEVAMSYTLYKKERMKGKRKKERKERKYKNMYFCINNNYKIVGVGYRGPVGL